ncbi:3-deoxy-manno-octulosonate cytidylyltransferase [Ciceribacter sp. RN22]|uniref:3-deoxy-manno-octulosonate cytidylyltransferase n=1 Tax=Ciceribacter sp. RN22 TaxID=2954932 RepID=UPI002093C27C|nr:3-deoxy-manno-octulosonate cytidylyltransferase [Ciceribacter sp. RN22]MCO6177959.1 3-deoxy-manno-octulosonate cytidylyltransferase [Ciceribacter sp. RN22]
MSADSVSSAAAPGAAEIADWSAFFSRYSHIVLVANSDQAQLGKMKASLPDTALFVFFNKVYKVLDAPFDGNALLVARSGSVGANIVYRREVAEVLGYFPGDRFAGVVNLRVDPGERFSRPEEFEGASVRHLDLASYFSDFYSPGRIPTSGFALAVWLAELRMGRPVMITGFSARRSARWKLFHQHDWTLEQVILRLLIRGGLVVSSEKTDINPYAALALRFPELNATEAVFTGVEVLSERLEGANHEIDRLFSYTKVGRAIHTFSRWLKPKKRKVRLAEKLRATEQNGGA